MIAMLRSRSSAASGDPALSRRGRVKLPNGMVHQILKGPFLVGMEDLATLANTNAGTISLTYFDHPDTTSGPAEVVNEQVEYLCGIVVRFGNLANCTI